MLTWSTGVSLFLSAVHAICPTVCSTADDCYPCRLPDVVGHSVFVSIQPVNNPYTCNMGVCTLNTASFSTTPNSVLTLACSSDRTFNSACCLPSGTNADDIANCDTR
jgi:hypothetical protein